MFSKEMKVSHKVGRICLLGFRGNLRQQANSIHLAFRPSPAQQNNTVLFLMEKTGCKIVCGTATALAVRGLMMMMMMMIWFKGKRSQQAKAIFRDFRVTPINRLTLSCLV